MIWVLCNKVILSHLFFCNHRLWIQQIVLLSVFISMGNLSMTGRQYSMWGAKKQCPCEVWVSIIPIYVRHMCQTYLWDLCVYQTYLYVCETYVCVFQTYIYVCVTKFCSSLFICSYDAQMVPNGTKMLPIFDQQIRIFSNYRFMHYTFISMLTWHADWMSWPGQHVLTRPKPGSRRDRGVIRLVLIVGGCNLDGIIDEGCILDRPKSWRLIYALLSTYFGLTRR